MLTKLSWGNAHRRGNRKASVLALAAALISSAGAIADCLPDPPAPGDGVTCSGDDLDGFRVLAAGINDLSVLVQDDASVTASANGAISLRGSGHSLNNLGDIIGGVTAGGTPLTAVLANLGSDFTLDNSGTIRSGVMGSTAITLGAVDVQNVNGVTLTNQAGGLIESLSGNAIRLSANTSNNGGAPILFELINHGLIHSGSSAGAGGSLVANYGIGFNTQPALTAGGLVDVRVVNSGRIEAGREAIRNSIGGSAASAGGRSFSLVNTGELVSRGEIVSAAIDVLVGNSAFTEVDVDNAGLIEGRIGARFFATDIALTNQADGIIRSGRGGDGMALQFGSGMVAGGTVSILNEGLIDAAGLGSGSNHGVTWQSAQAVEIRNTGSILTRSTGLNASAILNGVGLGTATVTIVNDGLLHVDGPSRAIDVNGTGVRLENSGVIETGGDDAIRVFANDATLSLTAPIFSNLSTGSIDGNVEITASHGEQIATVTNAGTISGGLGLGSNHLTRFEVVNSGTISGSVDLGPNDDLFRWLDGSRVATDPGAQLRGGAGQNQLRFEPGVAGIDVGQLSILQFYEMIVEGAGRVNLERTLELRDLAGNRGSAAVIAGELHLDNVSSGVDGEEVTIGPGGTLTGIGAVSGTLFVRGLMGPGVGGIGTLRISGSYQLLSGGTLEIEFDGTSADLVQVTGSASIAGSLRLSLPSDLDGDFDFIILSATGGVTGLFEDVEIPDNVTAAEIFFEPNQIRVALNATPTTDPDPDPGPDPGPDPDPEPGPGTDPDPDPGSTPSNNASRVQQTRVAAVPSVAQQATDAITDLAQRRLYGGGPVSCGPGSGLTDYSDARAQGQEQTHRLTCGQAPVEQDGAALLGALAALTLTDDFERRHLGSAAQPLFNNGESQSAVNLAGADRWTAYLAGGYDQGKFSASAGSTGFDYTGVNLLFGLDYFLTSRVVIGGGVSYSVADSDFRDDGKLESDSRGGVLYGGWADNSGYYASATLTYGLSDHDQWRPLDPQSPNAGRVQASMDSTQSGLSLLAGRDLTWNQQVFGAFVRFSASRVKVDDYTERGSQASADVFVVDGSESDSRVGALGGRWAWQSPRPWGHWALALRGSYEHEFESSADRVRVIDDAGSGDLITADLGEPDRSWGRIGASMMVVIRPSTVIGLSYDVLVGHADQNMNSVTFGARKRF